MSKIKAVLRGDVGWRSMLASPEPPPVFAPDRGEPEVDGSSHGSLVPVPAVRSEDIELGDDRGVAHYEPAGFGVDLPLPDDEDDEDDEAGAGKAGAPPVGRGSVERPEDAAPAGPAAPAEAAMDTPSTATTPARSARDRLDAAGVRIWRGGRPGWEAVLGLLVAGAATVALLVVLQGAPGYASVGLPLVLGYGALTVWVLGRLRGWVALLVWPALFSALLVPPSLNGNVSQLNTTLDYSLACLVLPAAVVGLRAWRGPRGPVEGSENDTFVCLVGGLALMVLGVMRMNSMQGYVMGLNGLRQDGYGFDARWGGAALIVLGVYLMRHSSTGKHLTTHDCGGPYRGRRLCTKCGRVIRDEALRVEKPMRRSWLCF